MGKRDKNRVKPPARSAGTPAATPPVNPAVAQTPTTPLGSPPGPPPSSWKDHPIAIAAIAVAATIGICVLIVKEWVIPTQTAALNNQIVSLTSQLGQIKDLTNEKKGAETKIKTLEAELAKANANLRGAQLANLFSAGNPYPVGLASVRVGDPISRVDQVYEASAVDKEASPAFWSVRVKHAAFRSATYYFDPDSRRQEISQVLFHFSGGSGGSLANIKLIGEQPPSKVVRELFRDPDGEALLLGKLTEALGTPRFLEKEKRYLWIVGPLEVTMDKDGSGRSFLVRKR